MESRTCQQLKESLKELKKLVSAEKMLQGESGLGFSFLYPVRKISKKGEHVGSLAKAKHILCQEANIKFQNVKTETP